MCVVGVACTVQSLCVICVLYRVYNMWSGCSPAACRVNLKILNLKQLSALRIYIFKYLQFNLTPLHPLIIKIQEFIPKYKGIKQQLIA